MNENHRNNGQFGKESDVLSIISNTKQDPTSKCWIDPMEWIEKNIIQDANGCWIWQLAKRKPPDLPYGIMKYEGRTMKVYRVVYTLTHGEIPKGLFVLHNCDVAECCNPVHLFLGSQLDNIKDRHTKNRNGVTNQWGERAPKTVITEKQAIDILQRHANGASNQILIEEYGRNAVQNVLAGKSYKYLPRPEPLDVLW